MKIHNNWLQTSEFDSSIYYTKEETISDAMANFDFRRKYSAEGKSITIDKIYVEQVLIQDYTNPLNQNKTDRKIHVPVDSKLKTGSLVEFENNLWLVISRIKNVDDAYKSAQIQQCNHLFRFQNFNSEIKEYWGILQKKMTSPLSEGQVLTTASNKYLVYLPYNEDTKKIYKGKRFPTEVIYDEDGKEILDTYKISDFSSEANHYGDSKLLSLEMESCGYNPFTDNIEQMICDYIEPVIIPSLNCKLTYTGKPELKVGGQSKTFNAEFYYPDGTPAPTAVAVWSLDISDKLKNKITITESTVKLCKLKVLNDKSIIGETFTLVVNSEGDIGNSEVVIKVVGMI